MEGGFGRNGLISFLRAWNPLALGARHECEGEFVRGARATACENTIFRAGQPGVVQGAEHWVADGGAVERWRR
jgi:hypothetical protein